VSTPEQYTKQDLDNVRALTAVATELKGMRELLAQHMESSDRRMGDIKDAIDGQLEGHENRISRLENNERATAIRSAAMGAAGGGITAILAEVVRAALHRGG
jgi:Flp pilus assembly CpaE family ATPase